MTGPLRAPGSSPTDRDLGRKQAAPRASKTDPRESAPCAPPRARLVKASRRLGSRRPFWLLPEQRPAQGPQGLALRPAGALAGKANPKLWTRKCERPSFAGPREKGPG